MNDFKNFVRRVLEWKTYACIMFAGTVIIYSIISLFAGSDMVSVWTLLQLLIISGLSTLLQGVAFNEDWLIKKAKYTTRMVIFVVPFLILLAAAAIMFNWFPKDQFINWIGFLAIFLICFVIMTIVFEVIFKVTGKKYDGLLGQYKQKNKKV